MRILRRQVIEGILRFADLLSVLAALWLWIWLLHKINPQFAQALSITANREASVYASLLLPVIWYWRMMAKGLHTSAAVHLSPSFLGRLLLASLQATALTVLMATLVKSNLWPLGVLFSLTSALMIVACRVVFYWFLKFTVAQGFHTRNLLVVGTNELALDFADLMASRVDLGYNLVGFSDWSWQAEPPVDRPGWKIICTPDQIHQLLKTEVVDEVAIAMPLKSFFAQSLDIVNYCDELGVTVRMVISLGMAPNIHYRSEVMDDYAMITKQSGDIQGWGVLFKRLLDPILGTLALLVLAPLLALVALLIKLDSKGPVFFVQQRVGQNKRFFNLYKFRTMVENAEDLMEQLEDRNEMGGAAFKIKNDPRVTRVGRFLRHYSIDELPQLVNVLKGEMTLVGPRPMSLRDYYLFDNDSWRRRFAAKPGLTCLWQIRGRNDLPFEEWMRLDLWYIDHWSLWLDFKILLKTVVVVLRGKGAA